MFACTHNKQAINSKSLQGKYEVDISSYFSDSDELTSALASMFLSQVNMTIKFEETKLIVDASGIALNLINAFADEETKMPIIAEYKIKNDSVLYVKGDKEEFKQTAVIRRLSDSYDYLQLIVKEQNGKQTALTLRRQTDEK